MKYVLNKIFLDQAHTWIQIHHRAVSQVGTSLASYELKLPADKFSQIVLSAAKRRGEDESHQHASSAICLCVLYS